MLKTGEISALLQQIEVRNIYSGFEEWYVIRQTVVKSIALKKVLADNVCVSKTNIIFIDTASQDRQEIQSLRDRCSLPSLHACLYGHRLVLVAEIC